jgi:hypothetical protein
MRAICFERLILQRLSIINWRNPHMFQTARHEE